VNLSSLGRHLKRAAAACWQSLLQPTSAKPGHARRPARLRARLLLSTLVIMYGLLGYRLYTLQIRDHEHWKQVANRQHTRLKTIQPERGKLLMRDGDRLAPAAVAIERGSLLVYGRKGRDVEAVMARLEEGLGGLTPDERTRFRRFLADGSSFYARRRQLDRSKMDAVRAARIPHSAIDVEPIRAYPYGPLAAQVLGLVRDAENADGEVVPYKGNTGLEARFQPWLVGVPGTREVRVDMRGRELVAEGGILQPAQSGYDLELAIDRSIQSVVEDELSRLGGEHSPHGAAAVVIDPRTGDVLAMASWPTYDPTNLKGDFQQGASNRAIYHVYEPGSTIKPLLIGSAWEHGLGAWDRPIYCPLRYKLPGRRKLIVDSHFVGNVREIEVIIRSSNGGAVQITARMSPEQIRRALEGFGLGHRSGIDLSGEVRGARPPRLGPTTLGSVGQGYALTVTPLQMAMAYAALANGGTLYRPRLVINMRDAKGQLIKHWAPQARSRPLSSALVKGPLREALVAVVNGDGGTARRARSKVYTIAGKTGTTKLLVDGQYHPREVVASFCGFAPAENPRIAFSVVAWGPSTKKKRAWGGTVAAPAAGRIAERALRLMRVAPSPKDHALAH
jgi:cell division protein FtsI/penicillin-binding protein 2